MGEGDGWHHLFSRPKINILCIKMGTDNLGGGEEGGRRVFGRKEEEKGKKGGKGGIGAARMCLQKRENRHFIDLSSTP